MQSNTQSIGRTLIAALALATTGSVGLAADAQYYVNDPLATTVAIADSAGEIAAMEADAFGAPLAIGEAPGRFTGKPYDADIGAYVFPFRNYRPEEGRWMSADPSGFPDGMNSTHYAPNGYSEVDSLGLFRTPGRRDKPFVSYYYRSGGSTSDTFSVSSLLTLSEIMSNGGQDLLNDIQGYINTEVSGLSNGDTSFGDSGLRNLSPDLQGVIFSIGNTRISANWAYSGTADWSARTWQASGSIDFHMTDAFTNPLDIWDNLPFETSAGGTNYAISGTWNKPFDFSGKLAE
jgi:RHS repeat-associated protein